MDNRAKTGATVWTGTAFNCPDAGDEMIFLHSMSRFINTSRGCNGGAITGRGIRIEEDTYTSQVNITIDSYMDGKSVACVYERESSRTVVNNSSIAITSGTTTSPYYIILHNCMYGYL